MPTTTTFAAIRDNYITLIEALTPTKLADKLFRRSPRHRRLGDWALGSGSAALRGFELVGEEAVPDPNLFDPSALERVEHMVLMVAYPVQVALYGRDDLDELEAVTRSDARQLRDLVYSAGNYLAGQSAAFVEILPLDRGDDRVWFRSFDVVLHYLEAQSLT